MNQFEITIGKMLVSPPNLIYTITKNGELFQGRVVSAGWMPEAFVAGKFRVYEDLEKFKVDGEYLNFKEISITMGEFKVIGITDLNSNKIPSPAETVLRLFFEILSVEEKSSDLGIIRRTLPDMLKQLKAAIGEYVNDNPDKWNDNIEYFLESSINDCKNCPDKFSDNLDEDRWYKIKTIKLAKNAAKDSVNILFYP
jgi:hypothetical protein